MMSAYQALFAAKGSLAFSVTAFIGRLPIAMTAIGIITMLALLYDDYALAGAVAASFTLSNALLSPQIARQVDRLGQSKVLPVAAIVSVSGLAILLTASYLNASYYWLFVGAVVAGCMPSLSAMVRARWTALYRGQEQLSTAFAFESVIDEVTFIAGPPISVGFCVMLFPLAGPLLAGIFLLVGVFLFVAQKSTEPVPIQVATTQQRSVIWQSNIQVLALLLLCMGVIVGTIDVASVAFAKTQDQAGYASLVLSTYAVSSCVAGLVFGTLHLQTPLAKLLVYAGIATAVSCIPLLFVSSVLGLILCVLWAGCFFAPSMIIAMSLVEQRVASERLTEALTWLLSGLSIGVAAGAAGAGQVIDSYGVANAFWVAIAAASVILLVVTLGYRSVR
ncbi:MFS transporter [Pseudomonas sp. F1_0610]|uniref:MFS transporter n=1 Tax=Pseudomonas sp. F1_0610 TaxID=3114284 RepID=UPI0039C154ED